MITLRRIVLLTVTLTGTMVGKAEAFQPALSLQTSKERQSAMVAMAGSARKVSGAGGRRPQRKTKNEGFDVGDMDDFAASVSREMYQNSEKYFSTLDSCPALVLNSDYQPLSYVPLSLWTWQDAVKAVFMDRVNVVATYSDRVIRSANFEMPLPSVIALKQYAQQHNNEPTFTRRNLYLRDGYRCQYCSRFFQAQHLSFDHVLPRRLGGRTQWSNVVTSCTSCNNRKSDCHPDRLQSIGMRLLKYPRVPTFYELQTRAKRYPPRTLHPTWNDYLIFPRDRPTEAEA
ncbi:unnamed protein product [Phaeothamnion confervicola]